MRLVHYQDCKSPHQLPLARELAKRLGDDAYRYVYRDQDQAERAKLGWGMSAADEPWMQWMGKGEGWRALVENGDALLTGFRDIELFEHRAAKGLKTFYQCERWFKPLGIVRLFGLFDCSILGWVRMLVPSYRKMAKRFVKWIQTDPNGRVLAIGPWAKKDMLRLGVPESKIIPWGYFVAPSVQQSNNRTIEQSNILKVLWVGRMIPLKRVDTIVRAVREVKTESEGERWSVQLTLVGDGPEKRRLVKMATDLPINFLPLQPIEKIRTIMREYDVFVFASNGRDGWGAVVSEALEEGMSVIGTGETGASATMLSSDWLFHSGDSTELADLLVKCAEAKRNGSLRGQGIGEWSAVRAAERLLFL